MSMSAVAGTNEPVLTFLQMESAEQFRPAAGGPEVEVELIDGADVKRLTLAVGRDFRWPSQQWDEDRWGAYLADPAFRHWAGVSGGNAVGILSVNVGSPPQAEIDSFGVLPELIGQGMGGAFLSASLRMIWAFPASRVWLHTSSDDHPHALQNYLARGFRPFARSTGAVPGLTENEGSR